MKIKDLKINFRYLGGNIACLSVDSISGESVHNDINNEEAIIIFNSLVGEKENCKTVESLLKENQELKKHLKVPKACNLKTLEDYKSYYEDTTREQILEDTYIEYCAYVNLAHRYSKLKKQLEEYENGYFKLSEENDNYAIKFHKYKTQQKEFIKWLENGIEKVKNTEFLDERIQRAGLIAYNRCLQKYKSIIGVSDENNIK
jgi:hypothetical protein